MARGHWITAQACLLLAKETATRTRMDLMTLFYPGIGGDKTPSKLDLESEMPKRPEVSWCNNEGA